MLNTYSTMLKPLPKVKHIALSGNTYQDASLGRVGHLIGLLLSEGIAVDIHENFALYLSSHGVKIENCTVCTDLDASTDVVASIGGDGTFLRTAEWVGAREIPILGINTGHLGFLASYSLDNISRIIRALNLGEALSEPRMVIMVEGIPDSDMIPFALNEVAVLKEESASMISVNTWIDGNPLADYRGDGLVVSTPTGSTAYNLSVGGPILQPTLSCMSLAPVAPHSLTLRPLVVDGNSRIRLLTTSRSSNYMLSLDGRSCLMRAGSQITIRRADYNVWVVHQYDENFITILRDKLYWGKH